MRCESGASRVRDVCLRSMPLTFCCSRSGEEVVCGACGLVLSMDYVQVDVEVTSTSEGRVLQGSFVPFRDGERKIVSQAPGLPIHARERGDARTPAFRSLARLATALQSTGVLERARALLRHAYSSPNTRLRRSTKALVAACLYLAVREEGHARTLHEVAVRRLGSLCLRLTSCCACRLRRALIAAI